MDATLLFFLLLDALQNGVVYGLLAMALVLVFAVTRVILVPIGELMMFAPLSYVWLLEGQLPGTLYLTLALLGVWAFLERRLPRLGVRILGLGVGLFLLSFLAKGFALLAYLASLALVLALGVSTYRLFFEPMREGTVLSYLIMAVGLHVAFQGLGLVFFGPEQYRPDPLLKGEVVVGLSRQALLVYGFALLVVVGLYSFFRTLYGKALLACAQNRVGARLLGIRPEEGGRVAVGLASGVAGVAGLLLAPLTNAAYFMGFMLGLKGFVAAILGGACQLPHGLLWSLLGLLV